MPDSEVNIGYRVFPLTRKIHKEEYPAVSPSRPALSQAGKTVLITGGSSGIGFEIARDFGKAGADRVIIIGRDQAKVDQAAEQLGRERNGSSSTFEGRSCQIADSDSIDKLWDNLDAERIRVDVLVLNAAMTDQFGKMESLGWRSVWKAFETNKYIVSVSTSAIHDFPAASYAPSYSLTKNSATLLLQQLAREFQSTDTQIVSFHPGAILTQGAKGLGADETTLPWDDVNLPASVAVWAASDEAAFLHGRFIWAPWDVEELGSGELRELLDKDEKFLRIGVHGLEDPAALKKVYVQ
ncbi:hypothetical protein NM208_g5570 [Fusarium decemcellulare]|uniref:Uncharacterized protein n=1 Tax=Fusarium decemcellulare TaxID=57161 RepID=A0ACC1SGL0_9HYPO|nr:hypothetical protein NM208_g5570 [Fusarium decemcellulare]